MARSKRRRGPRPPTFVWRRNDINILLACLDYSLQHKRDFNKIAITQIRKRTGKQVTTALIQQALKRETRLYGREGRQWTVEDLVSEGSLFLEGYTDDDRENIREEVNRIEASGNHYWLRSVSLESPSRSRTLSVNYCQRSEVSNLSNHCTPDCTGLGETIEQPNNTITRTDDNQVANQGSSFSRSHNASRAEAGLVSLLSRVKTEPGRGPSAETVPNCPPTIHGAANYEPRMRELEKELEKTLKENREQKNYIFTLSNRLSAAEYECIKIQESASRAAEYRDNVLMQRNLRYENSVLKGQLEQITSQREFIAAASTKSLEPSTRKIWQEFECIAMDLKDACSSVEITIATDSASNKSHSGQEFKGSDSESWIQRVVQCNFESFLSRAIDTDVSNLHIIRALTAAGISDLVFESDFPNFQAKESPILDQYRKHVLARAGPQMLEQLELLAYKSVISEEYFTSHILQDTAKILSGKLYEALAHLISPKDDTLIGVDLGDGNLFAEKEVCSPNTENPVANFFIEAIVRALELKQELVLSRSKYKLVFFNPGDVFDPQTMIKDGGEESAFIPIRTLIKKARKDCLGQRHKDENTRIKLCLFPALYSKRKKNLTADFGVDVNVGNCLLDCANFVTNGDQMGMEDGSFSLIVKGLVLV